VGHRAGLDGCGEDKIPCPHAGSEPGSSSPWRVAIPTELSRPHRSVVDTVLLHSVDGRTVVSGTGKCEIVRQDDIGEGEGEV